MAKLLKIGKQDVSMEQALSQFLLFRKSRGIADSTLEEHKYLIKAFIKRCNTWEDVSEVLTTFMAEDIRNNTYNIRTKYLKPYFEFCKNEGYLTLNPFANWKQRRGESRIVNIDAEVLELLLASPDQATFTGLRDHALIMLQLDTGIRPKEALTLEKDSICFKQLTLSIKEAKAKTRVARSLPISPITAQAIKKLLSFHHVTWKTKLIFCTCDGKPMSRHCWSKRLAHYSEQIGFKIRPYDLRHCFALYFLRAGGNVFSLQRIMGHSTLSMTQNYIALTDQDLQEQHQKSTPLNIITKSKRVKNI